MRPSLYHFALSVVLGGCAVVYIRFGYDIVAVLAVVLSAYHYGESRRYARKVEEKKNATRSIG